MGLHSRIAPFTSRVSTIPVERLEATRASASTLVFWGLGVRPGSQAGAAPVHARAASGAAPLSPQLGRRAASRRCSVSISTTAGSSICSQVLTTSAERATCGTAPQHAQAPERSSTIASGSLFSAGL
jgi:hypothetical protein